MRYIVWFSHKITFNAFRRTSLDLSVNKLTKHGNTPALMAAYFPGVVIVILCDKAKKLIGKILQYKILKIHIYIYTVQQTESL